MRKAQVAMEFLMTYGWALLVVVVVIGVLVYIGVLNPSRFVGDQCSFPPGIMCTGFKVDAGGDAGGGAYFQYGPEHIFVSLQNGFGRTLAIVSSTDVSLTGTVGGSSVTCGLHPVLAAIFTSAYSWADGTTIPVVLTCTSPLSEGEKLKGEVSVTYQVGGLSHTKVGKLVATVEP